jgi:hypothetical protein
VHGMTGTPTWKSWFSMRQRCTCAYVVAYEQYGARGIKVCERWDSFENFLADMGERPEGMTLDRYPDNNGNYEPGNCRWATYEEQSANRRVSVWLEMGGEVLTVGQWAKRVGLNYTTLRRRLQLGWSPERALNTPMDNRFSRSQSTKADRAIAHGGVTRSLTEWADATGIDARTLSYRFRRGWSVERALTEAVDMRRSRAAPRNGSASSCAAPN